MSKLKSPKYPCKDLKAAIADAKKLYEQEGNSKFHPLIIAKSIGYNSLSGPARRCISALRQYGFLDKENNTEYLSKYALTLIVRQSTSNEWKEAVKKVALKPPLFQKLHKNIEATEDSMAHDLIINCKFTSDGARKCAKIFKETMLFSGIVNSNSSLSKKKNNGSLSGHNEELNTLESKKTMQLENSYQSNKKIVQIPLLSGKWARLEASFPMTQKSWDRMLEVLKVMERGLIEDSQEENTISRERGTP